MSFSLQRGSLQRAEHAGVQPEIRSRATRQRQYDNKRACCPGRKAVPPAAPAGGRHAARSAAFCHSLEHARAAMCPAFHKSLLHENLHARCRLHAVTH